MSPPRCPRCGQEADAVEGWIPGTRLLYTCPDGHQWSVDVTNATADTAVTEGDEE